MNYVTLFLAVSAGATFGYLLGAAMTTASLRDDLAELRLRQAAEAEYLPEPNARRILSAALIRAHVEQASRCGWKS